MRDLSFEPLIPAALWVGLAMAAGVLLLVYALRRPGSIGRLRWTAIIGLMAGGLLLALLILLNPTWVETIPPPAGNPLLSILVDDSASMSAGDVSAGQSRYAAACGIAAKLQQQLGKEFDLRIRTFDQTTSSATVGELPARRPEGQGTDVAGAIAGCFDDDRPQGQAVVLLSDGIHNASAGAGDVLAAVRIARTLAVPVYTQTLGGQMKGMDLAVEMRYTQDLAFVKQKVPLVARLRHRGIAGGSADVLLLREGEEIERQRVALSAVGQSEVRFHVGQDKVGAYLYEVRIEALPGETTLANNAASFLLRVIDEPIRVLVLEGKPYWDSKFLLRTLSESAAVELDSVVLLAEGRLMQRALGRNELGPTTGPQTKPARAESWKIITGAGGPLASAESLRRYQIVVLGRDSEPFLTDEGMANLQNWISRDGGCLVCYRGAPTSQANQRLTRLLPVKWTPSAESRFRLRLTDEGRDLNWLDEGEMLLRLPTLARTAQLDRSKPLAVVLAMESSAGSEPSPAVVYQPYGSGRVVVIEGSGMWRWAFLPPQYQEHDGVYWSLWQSMLRWMTSGASLLPGQKMMLRADKVRFATAEPATATLLVREEAGRAQVPPIELAGADGQAKAYQAVAAGEDPGAYRVSFGKLPEGRYQAKVRGSDDSAARVVFHVANLSEEQLNLDARPDLMERIAGDSGGAVLKDRPADEIRRHYKDHLARMRPPRVQRNMAWDRWWALGAVLSVWTLSWFVRRNGGLV